VAERGFGFCAVQDKLLFVCLYVLLNLATDVAVEKKVRETL
jgi:hypothetical protein